MNYGLYLSATGVLTNSYRQDVIANNLANSETVGFKRSVAEFQERLTEAQQRGLLAGESNPLLENLGGGVFALPTSLDTSQGELESTGNPMDVAIEGSGHFAVQDHGQTYLTRDGRFQLDQQGNLIRSTDRNQKVLDANLNPIVLDPRASLAIKSDGTVTQNGVAVACLGNFKVSNPADLKQVGDNLLSGPNLEARLTACPAVLHSGFVERANVDPAQELASLMDTQRQLEANANMIRYQDETLGECVNSVGKIS